MRTKSKAATKGYASAHLKGYRIEVDAEAIGKEEVVERRRDEGVFLAHV